MTESGVSLMVDGVSAPVLDLLEDVIDLTDSGEMKWVHSKLVRCRGMNGGEITCLGAQNCAAAVHAPTKWSPVTDFEYTQMK